MGLAPFSPPTRSAPEPSPRRRSHEGGPPPASGFASRAVQSGCAGAPGGRPPLRPGGQIVR